MYGVVTNAEDIEDVEAYSIVRNPQAGWVTEDVGAEKVLHIKANTDFDSKRGLPTLFPVRKNLERADKLLRNMSVMAQVQATFAVIRKHKQFAPSSVSAYQQGQSDFTGVVPASGRALQMQQMFAGSIIDSSDKTEYEFPSAGVDASGLVAILQAELRAVCSRLIMPDFMLLSDSTQSNFSGILVAEAPSTKNFERVQAWFARRFGDGEYGRREAGGGQLVGAMWRVLATAVEHGLLPPETLTDLEIQCEGPSLVARDKKQETDRAKVLSDAGLLSDATWSKWEGLDAEQEKQQGAKKQAPPSPMGGPPPGPGGGPPNEPHPPGSGGGEDETPDFFSEGLREEKDASGREHAADGKFGSGGGSAKKESPREKWEKDVADIDAKHERAVSSWRERKGKRDGRIEALDNASVKDEEFQGGTEGPRFGLAGPGIRQAGSRGVPRQTVRERLDGGLRRGRQTGKEAESVGCRGTGLGKGPQRGEPRASRAGKGSGQNCKANWRPGVGKGKTRFASPS